MKQFNISEDPQRYVAYYHNQAGGYMPGFSGASSMYGAGLGGLFRGLFRMAMPLLKKGIGIAKPHLKAAAKNIVSDVISKVVNHRRDPAQGGSGMLVMSRTNVKRPPGVRRVSTTIKKKGKTKKRSVTKRKATDKQRINGGLKKRFKNIF